MNESTTNVTSQLYTMDFLLQEIDYTTPEDLPVLPVHLIQDLDYGYEVNSVNIEERYLWFMYSGEVSEEDSLDVIVSIRYQKENSDSTFSDLWLEFAFREGVDQLEPHADGSYRYKDLEILYDRLLTQDWGQTGWAVNKTQLLITVPEPIQMENYSFYLSTNGTYFDDEKAELISVNFDEENQSIVLRGSIDSYVKELNCGFYSRYHLTKGNFNGIIQ